MRWLLLVLVLVMSTNCTIYDVEVAPLYEVVKTWAAVDSGLYDKAIEAGLGCRRMIWRDDVYKEASRSSIEAFIEWDKTDRIGATKDYDCDDFALAFDASIHKWCPGIAAGQIGFVQENGEKHAVNIIFMDGKFWCLEPQTDEFFELAGEETCWFVF